MKLNFAVSKLMALAAFVIAFVGAPVEALRGPNPLVAKVRHSIGSKGHRGPQRIDTTSWLRGPARQVTYIEGIPIPAGAADPYVSEAQGSFTGTVGSTDLAAGDMVYFDGTDWEKADATLHTTFAEAMSIYAFTSGEPGIFCTKGVITDIDAPYTQGAAQYLSETAGAITATIPVSTSAAAAGVLFQVVGFALSTSLVRVEIAIPHYEGHWFEVAAKDTTAEPGLGVITDGWAGPGIDAAAEVVYIMGRLPDNFVELELARMITNNSAASAVDYDFTIAAGYDSASNAQDTGTAITADTAMVTPADNLLIGFNLTSMFDSGLVGPGRNFSVKVDPDGVGGGEQQILGLALGVLVV